MKELFSNAKEAMLGFKRMDDCDLTKPHKFSNYSILFVKEGKGVYHADFGKFRYEGPALLFSTPLQQIYIAPNNASKYSILQFHGDFYCIEYHKAQVACNGLLFNNIYIEPSVRLTGQEAGIFDRLLNEVEEELNGPAPDEIVLRAYLQLLLAKASRIKIGSIRTENLSVVDKDPQMEHFIRLLEEHYLKLHKPNDYAKLLAMTPNNLGKRCARYFKKTPSRLIQERIILESKKMLHLTRKSVKEIAYTLNFEDEFYFSRFFKKFTRVSPRTFRKKTGISKVAEMSG